ncbi:MAG: inorganic phosphate transporter [Chlamydiota bacterium]
MAWNIGANDVANAMGTSVGSKALTLKRAVLLASVLEFSGAFLVGSHVSETIQSGIIDPDIFASEPIVFVLGMMSSLFATGLWLQMASYFGMPVSTTHAIIGALLGFGGIIGGVQAVYWGEIVKIVLSWITSPLMSGIISYCIFRFIQRRIFYQPNPLLATKKIAPFLVFCAFTILSLAIIFDGLKNLHLDIPFPQALLFSSAIGALFAFGSLLIFRRMELSAPPTTYQNPQDVLSLEKALKHLRRVEGSSQEEVQKTAAGIRLQVENLAEKVEKSATIQETMSPLRSVEKIFVLLQIVSASLVAFAHGANDVANAIGPVAAVVQALQSNSILQTTEIPTWILLLGGIGIVVGLATWGWRVIETIGRKITELTPTRGFSAEFGAACTILLASKLGIPISTTHSLVGSVLGVGLARGLQALNLRTLRDIALSWIVTLPFCACLSILLFYFLQAIYV